MYKKEQYQKGLTGESEAEKYLASLGMTCLETRFRAEAGEIDLIMLDRGVIVFVEVKYRPQSRLGSGLAGITPGKRQHLLDAARAYIAKKPQQWKLAYLEVTRAGVFFREDVLHEN